MSSTVNAAPERGTEAPVRPKPRRITELLLLLVALAIGVGANILVDPERAQADPRHIIMSGTVLGVGALLVHLVLWIRARYADPYLLPLAVALNGLGLAMIHRIDLSTNQSAANTQVVWTGVAMLACCVVLWLLKDHRRLRNVTYIMLLLSAVLLLLPMIPGLGVEINGARLWISVAGRTFQPGEIAKITLAIFFAGYLSTNRDLILLAGRKIGPVRLPRFRDIAPMLAAWAIAIGVLVLQKDMGTAIMFFGLFLAMVYLATGRLGWIVLGVLLMAVGGFAASRMFSHVALRLDAWLDAFNPDVYNRSPGGSAQIVQGLFGLASGGLFGQGLGQGRPDLVSYSNSDMIITAFGEELGLIGLGAILVMFLLFATRGLRAALGTRDAFGKLLAAGLSSLMVLQLLVVIGGVTRLLPLTGLTTPFMSAGGSSLLSNWIIVAILLAISHSARRPVVTGPATDEDLATFERRRRAREERRDDERTRTDGSDAAPGREPATEPTPSLSRTTSVSHDAAASPGAAESASATEAISRITHRSSGSADGGATRASRSDRAGGDAASSSGERGASGGNAHDQEGGTR
ncbi:FtsW/RodA/SpoVE family cell cycle protein [Kocuria indica]|uniref:peptidoglycan glycosyltransferase n=1 Tax=Kocuria marina subsp. indica TaxID=1049583 RepID=A0A6N9R0W2_9MICC|nr:MULTISPECIES: FtsW/RodA/SpoVE family cell cycle protein [Kocuria]MCT1615253.1 FtsW/RodA/SpoVE family cell cycle protein [Kocuria marina]NDO78547.1 FtsW/RodA/SpoVE family cell cycle protein [Kocuria indica]